MLQWPIMKYGIMADPHSNLEAFKVVLEKLKGMDQIICLGDVVGYGPNPNQCLRLVKELKGPVIAGNHDKATTQEMEISGFNRDAREAILWTREQLTRGNIEYLKNLPLTLQFEDFIIVHGSLREPLEEYITGLSEALPTFEKMPKPLCFVAHSHVPLCIVQKKDGSFDGWMLSDGEEVKISQFSKVIINPGGVGQPRDGDPRASFGIYDSTQKLFKLQRVAYDFKTTQEKMKKAGLPQILIERLAYGK